MTTVDIVCTTIGDGSFLKAYADEILAAGAEDRVRMIVIPDRKTPPALYAAATEASRSVDVLCLELDGQEAFLASCGAAGMFPLDSDGRRNIGYLLAYESGADVMISIDDDNLPGPGWLAAHEHALAAGSMPFVTSWLGFFNPCDLLQFEQDGVWARGFPYSKREFTTYEYELKPCSVAINAGLWIGDPDVDAITRLALHPQSALSFAGGPGPVVLGDGMWAPVNSQNTAVRHDVIPAYCYFESSKRFADIWQGYFAQACAQHLGHHVRFGTPAADCSVRNDHDLLRDLSLEFDGIMMLDKVLPWLTELKLTGSTYAEAYECLKHELCEFVVSDTATTRAQRKILFDVATRMAAWLRVTGRLA